MTEPIEVVPGSVKLYYAHGGSVENGFLESITQLLWYDAANKHRLIKMKGVEGLYIADNRERACRDFMRPDPDGNAEWLFFVDTDIIFPPMVLDELVESADPVERPIMSALYFGYMNNEKLRPVWYGRDPLDGRIVTLKSFSAGPQRLGVVGMGCCVIHRSVFEKFGNRYAHTGWLFFGHDVAPWTPPPAIDNNTTCFGEDNTFCHRANELGIPVYGNGSITVQHRKKRYEGMETFLEDRRAEVKVEADGSVTEDVDPAGIIARLRGTKVQADSSGRDPIRLVKSDDAGHKSGLQPRPDLGLGSNRAAAV